MEDWDLRKFRILRALQVHGTVTAAAQALSLTPSAVSQALSALARQVGAAVVEPDGRRVRLTEVAHLLLRHADVVFAQLEQAQAEVAAYAGGEAGLVQIGAVATTVDTLVLPAIRLLRQAHPGVEVRVHEAEATELYERLGRGEVDVALSLAAQAPSASGRRFSGFALLTDPLDIALPLGHRLAGEPGLRLADLADEPWVFGAAGPWRDITLAVCADAGFVPGAAHTASDWGAILSIVAEGMGVALIPRLVGSRRAGVAVRVLAADQPKRHVVGAVRKGSEELPRLREVVRCLHRAAEDRQRHPVSAPPALH